MVGLVLLDMWRVMILLVLVVVRLRNDCWNDAALVVVVVDVAPTSRRPGRKAEEDRKERETSKDERRDLVVGVRRIIDNCIPKIRTRAQKEEKKDERILDLLHSEDDDGR